MAKATIVSFFCLAVILAQGVGAQAQGDSAARKERFDRVLPQAMREHNVDMWIQVIIGTDSLDLGAGSGYCVFTDRGGDRIERAIFGFNYAVQDPEIYDIVGEEGNASGTGLGLDTKFDGLLEFVAERDPDHIAIGLDGISYTDYHRLVKELGTKYAERITSAENLIADFRPKAQQRETGPTRQSDAMWDLVRREKFDVTLPQIMRDHKIDMWINVLREGDYLSADLGSDFGYCVITDRGGSRIERAIFNSDVQDVEAYDIIGGDGPQAPSDQRFEGLREFVAERDPKVIGLNVSEKLDLADGVSYKDYTLLVEALGEKYAERIVSAEFLIIDFITRRTTRELVLFGQAGPESIRRLDQEFAKVVPGVTMLKEIRTNAFVRDRDGNEDNINDYVVQRGDLLGTPELSAYVLREGETALPPEYQMAWEHAMKVRGILRRNIFPGVTVRETMERLESKLEEAGYYHNPVDRWDKSYPDQEKTQIHLDLHAWGGQIDIAIPRIAPLNPSSFNEEWSMDLKIPLNHMFTLEYMVHMPVPEWGTGKHIYLPFHDPGVVTERGVEFPYPPIEGIRLIH